jgi:hypothetical protein
MYAKVDQLHDEWGLGFVVEFIIILLLNFGFVYNLLRPCTPTASGYFLIPSSAHAQPAS